MHGTPLQLQLKLNCKMEVGHDTELAVVMMSSKNCYVLYSAPHNDMMSLGCIYITFIYILYIIFIYTRTGSVVTMLKCLAEMYTLRIYVGC